MCKRRIQRLQPNCLQPVAKVSERMKEQCTYELSTLIDNYNGGDVRKLCSYLQMFRDRKLFVIGEGFADLICRLFCPAVGREWFHGFQSRPFL